MSARSPLYWHQGLFLTPQHFQLSDLYQRYKTYIIGKYALKHFWGVGTLELREEALAAGKVEITRFEAFFPEGVYAGYPGNAVLAARSVDPGILETDKPVTVYVGLKRFNQSGKNVTIVQDYSGTPASTIYVAKADPESVPDLHGDGPEGGVKFMAYALRIFFENELADLGDFDLIPVARIVREGDKTRYVPEFIPPCLVSSAIPALDKLVRDVTDLASSRARALEDYKMRGDLTAKEFDPGYMVFLMALMTLNRYVPELTHIVEAGGEHPWIVYGVLRRFIGELSTFADDFGATGERFDGVKLVPDYDHQNLTECFPAVRQLIERMIEGIGTSIELLTALNKKERFFVAELPERVFKPANRFWLVVRSEEPGLDVPRIVAATVKLCAAPLLATLLVKAVPGIALLHSKNPPAGLPKRSGTHYFLVDSTSPMWLDVAQNRSLALFWDNAPEDLSVHLAVLRGK